MFNITPSFLFLLYGKFVSTPIPTWVPVVPAVKDTVTGYWGYTPPAIAGAPSQIILVSPADAPGVEGPPILTGPLPLPEQIVHTGGEVTVPQEATVTITPVADDIEFNDLILVFPDGSGLDPIYIVFRSPRNMPGTVTGKGQPPGEKWLSSAGQGEGAPIPSQIADKLRGKTYSSFGAFRRAFWKAVSENSELKAQFKNQNLANIENGKSPFVSEKERIGGRQKHELPHVNPINSKGSVYDVDNINIMTPKLHIKTHRGGN
ncbi:S-type pyocin domain-containing protein [Erwinia oleae]|uniref:S-type pyocin domain-containing protein n=1 Tax=Erwinia oleae TaxID=796334 RepID=UPI0009079762|nr:S-type pyocin domain-containing protein [Erwinia oleae]